MISDDEPVPHAVDKKEAAREVAAMMDGAGLKVQALRDELVITNPDNPDKGRVYVDYELGLVSLERPAWDFWGVLEGYQAAEPAYGQSPVSVDKIVTTLTDRPVE